MEEMCQRKPSKAYHQVVLRGILPLFCSFLRIFCCAFSVIFFNFVITVHHTFIDKANRCIIEEDAGLILHGGIKGDCLHALWSLPWCP